MVKLGSLFITLWRSSFFIFTFATSTKVVLPSPSGPYTVIHNTLKLVDESRIDPLDPNHEKRQLMISSFYPIQPSTCEQICLIPYISRNAAPYIDDYAARLGVPSGAFTGIQWQACCKTSQENRDAHNTPLVLLLHGLGGTQLFHSVLAQTLASEGYAVITMDHTFESAVVEFPDGSIIPSLNDSSWNPAIPGALNPLQDIRVDDVHFILSQLRNKDIAKQLIPGSLCGFNTNRVAAIGHSFGGSTSINLLMKNDSRFVGALNMDGTQFGEITNMQQPAVLFGTTGVTPVPRNSTTDLSWAETLRHAKGWRAEIGLNNITHYSFFDAPFLYKSGALELPHEIVDGLIGILDGGRSSEIITTYITAFLDFVLRGGNSTLFDAPSEQFPEIVVL